MYQALYRKWRPKAFDDVIGQEHITQTLRRQVEQKRLSHAYLFTGTRGTGKTTCAKILAKAVNCEHPVDGDPCNRCPACLGIDNGSFLDVLELDAASNNGVDHVRALRDEAVYSPANVRYRVYIVDEVHMLSTQAFNALLKILEEPPAHLIFILATTELHKVPATILSRCQRFAFKRIQPEDIARRLEYVAGEEGIMLQPQAAELLARLSDGALRDALSLLDQCAASGGETDVGRVMDVLGLAGNLQTAELMQAVLERDVPAALLKLEELYRGGKDVAALLGELSTLNRDMLIGMTAPEGGEALLSGGYDRKIMDELSRGVSPKRLIHMAVQLQNTAAALPVSTNRRTDAELCLIRLCDESLCGDVAALTARLERLEAGGTPVLRESTPRRERGRPAEQERTPPPVEKAVGSDVPPWEDKRPSAGEPPLREEETEKMPSPTAAAERPDTEAPPAQKAREEESPCPPEDGLWKNLVEKYKNQLTPMYWYFLDDAFGRWEGEMLAVYCGDEFTLENLNCPEVEKVISSVTGDYLGKPVAVRFLIKKEGDEPAQQADKLDDLIRLGGRLDNFTIK